MIFDWQTFLVGSSIFLICSILFWCYSTGNLKIPKGKRNKKGIDLDPGMALGLGMLIGVGGISKALLPLLQSLPQIFGR